ncbi:MAG: tape measure protein, partial [Planctomycetota bacterium]
MAKAVELSTVQAVSAVKTLRSEVKALANELKSGGAELASIGKRLGTASTKVAAFATQMSKSGSSSQALKRQMFLARREVKLLTEAFDKQEKKLEEAIEAEKKEAEALAKATEQARIHALATKKLSDLKNKMEKEEKALAKAQEKAGAAMASQVKKATQAGLKFDRLTTQVKQLKLGQEKEAAILGQLGAAFTTLDNKLRGGVLTREELIKAETAWIKSSGDVQNTLTGIKTERTNRGLSRLSEVLQDAGSSAVLALGPLSGVGARLITLNAIVTRSNIAVALATAALVGFTVALVKTAVGAVKVGLQFEKIEGALRAATGSMGAAKRELGFVINLSEELGTNLQSSAEQFSKLAAAARGTALEGQGARDIFEGISVAAAALRLNTEQTTGALRAIEQMISKGNVQAEELRGQLGERLPGAFQLAAQAMGVTTQELNKMLESGDVLATDLLPKLAKLLMDTFSAEAAVAAGGLAASFEKLKTEITLLLDEIEDRNDLLQRLGILSTEAGRAIEDLRSSSVSDEFTRLIEDLSSAEERFARLAARSDLSDLDKVGLERFNEDFIKAMGELEQKAEETTAFVREKFFRLQELELRPDLRGIEALEAQELREFFAELQAGAVTATPSIADLALTTMGLGTVIEGIKAKNIQIPELLGIGGPELEMGITAMNQYKKLLEDTAKAIEGTDAFKELNEEVASLGETELQSNLKALDARLKDITASIEKMPTPEGISEADFELIQKKAIADATAGIEELRAELIMLSFNIQAADIGKTIPPDARDKMQATRDDMKELSKEFDDNVPRINKLREEIDEMGISMAGVLAAGINKTTERMDKFGDTIDDLTLKEANEGLDEMHKAFEKAGNS